MHADDGGAPSQAWSDVHGLEVIGVSETAGLVLADGVVTVAGSDPVWRLTATSAVSLFPGHASTTGHHGAAVQRHHLQVGTHPHGAVLPTGHQPWARRPVET